MRKIFVRSTISIGQVLSVLLLAYFAWSFFSLFQNEFMVGTNDGNIKLIASYRKNKQPIARDEKIQDIIINGYKRSDFTRNTWIKEDNSHLVEQTYYASGGNQFIEYQSNSPIISLSFTAHEMPSAGILTIYLDDKLFAEIDSFSYNQSRRSHIFIMPGELGLSQENAIWYFTGFCLLLVNLLFCGFRLYRQISIKQWLLFFTLLVASLYMMDWALSHHHSSYFQFWNSIIEREDIYLLIPTLLVQLFVLFQLMLYWARNSNLGARMNKVILVICYALVPIMAHYILENGYSSYQNVEMEYVFYNLVAYGLIFLSFSWIFASFKKAGVLLFLTALLFGFITNILINTRSEPLLPYHFYQLTTGLNVATKTEFEFTDRILQSFLLTIIFSAILLLNPINLRFVSKKLWRNFVPRKLIVSIKVASSALAIFFTFWMLPTILLSYADQAEFYLNTQRMQSTYAKRGFFLAFSHFYMESKLEEPNYYGSKKIKEIYSPFEPIDAKSSNFPNIIMIQNESQADYGALTDLDFSVDPMEFQHSLKEDTISGQTYVSVFGGGTSNTEYEVLTSNALAGLPLNIFPYQQLVNGKSDSLAWTLAEYGYERVAIHPETKNNYRRERVYEYLGFDTSYFDDSEPSISDLFKPRYERNFVSDQSLYQGVRKLLEQKSSTKPLFSFVVTMQGHGSYTSSLDSYQRTVQISNLEEQNGAATEYLTSLRTSDQALKELVEFLKSYEEPTVLVLYGDHQPTLSMEYFATYMNSSAPDTVYKTPFLIWANFDLPEQEGVSLSVNYLAPYLLNLLSESKHPLPVSSYYQYMYRLFEEVPIQTTWGYYLSDGTFTALPKGLGIFDDYKYILYNHLKDSQDYINYYQ